MTICKGHEKLSSDYSSWKCGGNCPFCGGECSKCFPPEPAPPTPSITVGTQVRLTGVVSKVDSAATAKHIGVKFGNSEDEPLLWFSAGEVEVIRQPFKRGEVVWSCGAVATGEQYVVFNDETNGRVDVVHCLTGTATTDNDISRFERRP